MVGKLTRLMLNIGGPASSRRAVLSGVVHSILLYGAPIWAEALKKKKYFLEMERTQRKILIRIASAYRTAPTVGLQVITGIPPIDLLALERKEIFENPEEVGHTIVRNRTIQEWQKRWNENTNKGQSTKQLIPDISKWLKCTHRQVDYYLTQALTGHGQYKTYTKKKGADDRCMYCDTAEHTIFKSNRWAYMYCVLFYNLKRN